jgi:hypothetical protein
MNPATAFDRVCKVRYSMPHEAANLPDRPEGDPPSTLDAAARHLAATPPPGGGTALGSREVFRRRQERDLIAWAEENGRLIAPGSYLPELRPGGEEHRIATPGDLSRYWKATHPGRCGFTVVCGDETGGQPELTNALLLEYLERLQLQNGLFADDIRLEGVALEAGKLVVVTSQEAILGSPVKDEEMSTFMEKLWFKPLRGLSLGRPGALAFYRDLDEVAAFDAHPGNFVRDDNGVVLPIDLVLLRADEALQKAFAPHLE